MTLKTSQLNIPRASHNCVALKSTLFIIGGINNVGPVRETEVSEYSSGEWKWKNLASNLTARYSSASIAISENRILTTGGLNVLNNTISSCEILSDSAWVNVSPMNFNREGHCIVELSENEVMVIGGRIYENNQGTVLDSVEIYNLSENSWHDASPLHYPRMNHIAVRLNNGKIMVAGGYGNGVAQNSAELYDPVSGTWQIQKSMNMPRMLHAAALMNDGNVMVSGGWEAPFSEGTTSCEIFNVNSGEWISTAPMLNARSGHRLVCIPESNSLVVCGGVGEYYMSDVIEDGNFEDLIFPVKGLSVTVNSVLDLEIFDGALWSAGNSLPYAFISHAAENVSDKVIITGGKDARIPDGMYINQSIEFTPD